MSYHRSHRRSPCRWIQLCILGCGLSISARAGAIQEGEWVLGLAPTYAYLVQGSQSEPKGGGASLFMHYGLSEAIAARLSALWTGHAIDGAGQDEEGGESSGGFMQVVSLALGFQYSFDLLSLSPAIEAGTGLLYQRIQQESAIDVTLQLGVSVDYRLLGWLSVGAAFHYHAFISNPTEYPVYFDAGPRIAVRWQ